MFSLREATLLLGCVEYVGPPGGAHLGVPHLGVRSSTAPTPQSHSRPQLFRGECWGTTLCKAIHAMMDLRHDLRAEIWGNKLYTKIKLVSRSEKYQDYRLACRMLGILYASITAEVFLLRFR